MNHLIDLAFPGYMAQEGTLLLTGHGKISDSSDLAYYQEMVTIIRDRIKDMKSKGMSHEQSHPESDATLALNAARSYRHVRLHSTARRLAADFSSARSNVVLEFRPHALSHRESICCAAARRSDSLRRPFSDLEWAKSLPVE